MRNQAQAGGAPGVGRGNASGSRYSPRSPEPQIRAPAKQPGTKGGGRRRAEGDLWGGGSPPRSCSEQLLI